MYSLSKSIFQIAQVFTWITKVTLFSMINTLTYYNRMVIILIILKPVIGLFVYKEWQKRCK